MSALRWLSLMGLLVAGWQYPVSGFGQGAGLGSLEELTALLQRIDPYRPSHAAAGTVHVFGSTSMDAMAHGWANGFRQFHPQAQVIINGRGAEATLDVLKKQPTAVGMISRPVTEEELAELRQAGWKNPTAFVVAREALGVFVHASNPVASISGEQLRAVFTMDGPKEGLTWSIMGASGPWADRPIHVISRVENSGTQQFLADFVFQSSELRPGMSAHVSNAEVLEVVAKDPLAIAICGVRSQGKGVKRLQLVAGGRVVPSDDHAILTGQYPLTRPLTLVIDLGQQGPDALAAREFVKYALGQSGQAEAVLVGFFPVDLPLLRAEMQKLGAPSLH
ncbi:MAG: phosphate-binding protein [Pirellulaceae bacterium]|nr:MAG: phosphate-binding protein [Pirellulaceae bacterium]